jgi:hypothetical protein
MSFSSGFSIKGRVEIANTPGVTEAALLVMLTTPHAGMPMFILSPSEAERCRARLASLSRPGSIGRAYIAARRWGPKSHSG